MDKKKKIVAYIIFSLLIFGGGFAVYFSFLADDQQPRVAGARMLDLHLPDAEERLLPQTSIEAYEELAQELFMEQNRRVFETEDGDISLTRPTRGGNDRNESEPTVNVAVVPSRNAPPVAAQNNNEVVAEWQRTLAANAERDREREEQRRIAQAEAEQRRIAEQQQREEQLAQLQEQQRVAQELMMAQLMAQQGGGMHQEPPPLPTTQEQQNRFSEENVVMPVTEQGDGIVSSLRRSTGFHGSGEMAPRRNTILATVNGRQVISEGQNVRVRLREPMQVGRQIIPIGSVVVGVANIGVDRVFITISSIENNGVITPVRLTAFDYDGQHGLFVPGSLENETLREIGGEIASAIGTGATTSVSMINNQSAMEQIQGEVMRGAIQGTARYVGRRITQVRVVLQDNHRLFLVAQN